MIESFRPGIYRRLIRLESQAGAVRIDMEDDQHRMSVWVKHDGAQVTDLEGLATRTPYLLCPSAAAELRALIGTSLACDALALTRRADARQHCTHLLDLAALAIAHAARSTPRREYEIEAPWHSLDAPRPLTVWRDGALLWTWRLDKDDRILAPDPFTGLEAKRTLAHGERLGFDRDMLEAIFITRRAVWISGSRKFDMDLFATAAATGHPLNVCYAYHPVRGEHALRRRGSTRDFTAKRDEMLK